MKCRVVKMRKAGVAVPKYELRNQGEARGELSVVDTRENHLNRVVKLARLVCSPGDKQHVYTLYEPHLLWMNEDRFVLTGFPSEKDKPFSDMTFTEALRRLEHAFTMHGFRSTFRDWAAEQTAFPRDVCEAALAHVIKDGAEAAYFRSDLFEKRRQLMAAWARYVATEGVPQEAS